MKISDNLIGRLARRIATRNGKFRANSAPILGLQGDCLLSLFFGDCRLKPLAQAYQVFVSDPLPETKQVRAITIANFSAAAVQGGDKTGHWNAGEVLSVAE
jgi:hypothetical protein